MFFIPLNQIESVELVIHALRVAGGEADCSSCPARRVCTKQCLGIADSIQRMAGDGTLPRLDPPREQGAKQQESPPEEKQKPASDDPASHLKVIK
ncbi:MAG TPA: hypothetical protein ENN94_01730 [Geoalkalibacter subterraneus]|uniref:Uncharacterized protein n=1 Tax=Geoalkalibacter subterraneus TaxID=483547 RepID=A0A831PN44_9BACT|nr:hypothetical protein [Geoalkalibacter subterraneus]